MRYLTIIAIALSVLFSACATKKVGVSPKKKKEIVHSVANFPYIEAFHNGMRLKIKGDTDGAIEAFTKCLLIRQDDDAVYYALGQLYIAKKQDAEAVKMLEKAAQIDPSNIWYIEELAYLNYNADRVEEAATYFKKLVDYEPRNPNWLYGYGDCLLRQKKVAETIEVLNKGEEALGKNPMLAYEKYRLYMSLKKEKEAIHSLISVLEEYPNDKQTIAAIVDHYLNKGDINKSIEFLEKLSVVDSLNGTASMTLGEIYMRQGKTKEAYAAYKKGFKAPDVDAAMKMQLIISLQDSKRAIWPDILELAQIMEEQHPEDAKSYTIKGDLLMEQKKEKEALAAYRQALNYEKNLYPIWQTVLLMEYQQGDWGALYQDSKECLNYFTNMPMVYLFNGLSAIQVKKYDEAIESLSLGKSFVVNDKAMEAEFLGQLGEAYFSAKNSKEGKRYYQEAIAMDPESNLLKNNYAYRLAVAKIDLDLALSLINQAVSKSSNQYTYYDTRAWVYFQKGEYAKALEDLEKANQLEPNQKIVYEHMGDVYAKLNKIDKAIEFWTKALTLAPADSNLMKKIEKKAYYDKMD